MIESRCISETIISNFVLYQSFSIETPPRGLRGDCIDSDFFRRLDNPLCAIYTYTRNTCVERSIKIVCVRFACRPSFSDVFKFAETKTEPSSGHDFHGRPAIVLFCVISHSRYI